MHLINPTNSEGAGYNNIHSVRDPRNILIHNDSLVKQNNSTIPTYDQNLGLLLQLYPGKVLYSIKETASVLGLSYEFVRLKVLSGAVNAMIYGDRKMIHLNELTNLITKGIPQ